MCLLQHHLYLIKVIAMRLRHSKLIMAGFCLSFGTPVIFFVVVVQFIYKMLPVILYALMGTYISG